MRVRTAMAVSALLISGLRAAADEWTGLYVGGALGAGQLGAERHSDFVYSTSTRSTDQSHTFSNGPNGIQRHEIVTVHTYDGASRYEASGSGDGPRTAFGGIVLGGNARSGNFVWGAEVNFDWSDLTNRSAVDYHLYSLETYTTTQSIDGVALAPVTSHSSDDGMRGQYNVETQMRWKATMLARAGVLLTERTLLYGLLGVTYAGFEQFDYSTVTGYTTPFHSRDGLTFGAGIEANLGSGWHLRTEYRRTNLGAWHDRQSEVTELGTSPNVVTIFRGSDAGIDTTIDEARAVLTYRFATGLPW